MDYWNKTLFFYIILLHLYTLTSKPSPFILTTQDPLQETNYHTSHSRHKSEVCFNVIRKKDFLQETWNLQLSQILRKYFNHLLKCFWQIIYWNNYITYLPVSHFDGTYFFLLTKVSLLQKLFCWWEFSCLFYSLVLHMYVL